jgi:hypothetical protein
VATTQLNVPTNDTVFDLSMRDANATLNVFGGPSELNIDDLLTLGKGHISLFDDGFLDIFNEADLNGGSVFMTGGPSGSGRINVENTGIVFERGTQVTLGRDGLIDVEFGGIWDILTNNGIRQTGASSIDIESGGVFEKTGGTGTSVISGGITDDGLIEVGVGKLEFRFNVSGSGDAILFNRAQLQFDKGVDIPTIEFNASNETLTLQQPQNFFAQIDGFGLGDAVKLLGNWRFDSLTHSGGITELTLNKNSTFQTFDFGGNLALHVASGAVTTITT